MALFNFQNNSGMAENTGAGNLQEQAMDTTQPEQSIPTEFQEMNDSNPPTPEGFEPEQTASQGVKLTVESDVPPTTEEPPLVQDEAVSEAVPETEEDPIEKFNRERAEAALEAVTPVDSATQAAEDAINESQMSEVPEYQEQAATDQVVETGEQETAQPEIEASPEATVPDESNGTEAPNQFEALTADMLEEVKRLVAERKAIEDEYEEDRRGLKEERDEKIAAVDEKINAIKVDMHNALNNIHTAVEALPTTKATHPKSHQNPEKKAA